MKHTKLFLSLAFSCAMSGLTLAQTESRPVNLGTIPEFTNQFLSAAKTDGGAIHMALAGNKFIDVKVIDNQTTEQEVRIYGEVQNAKTSIFYFYGRIISRIEWPS